MPISNPMISTLRKTSAGKPHSSRMSCCHREMPALTKPKNEIASAKTQKHGDDKACPRFALWAAEEIGLCGSKEYVRTHSDELASLVTVMNFDMTSDPFGFWCPRANSQTEAFSTGVQLLRGVATRLSAVGMRQDVDHLAGLHSDHQPFMLAGVPTLALLAKTESQGAHYYHSVGDTFDKVSLPAFSRAALVGAQTMWSIGNSAQRPFPHQSPTQVREMIDEASLHGALIAQSYSGPPMQA